MLGHHRHDSETPLKWHFAGGPILAGLWWYLDCLCPHQLRKKNVVQDGPPLAKLAGLEHEYANHL